MLREYIVTKELLNIRSRPTEESDFKGDLKLNTKVWLDDQEFIGTVPLGGKTNKWLMYNSNLFVAKDGVKEGFPINVEHYISERFDEATKKINSLIDYNFLLNIPYEIKQTKGRGAIIGILDQPLSTEINFSTLVRPTQISVANSPEPHGNFMAGLIAGNSKTIRGISPEAMILDLPIFDSGGFDIDSKKIDSIVKCLKSFSKKVILNVSRSKTGIDKNLISQLVNLNNLIIVSSANSNEKLNDLIADGNFTPIDSIQSIIITVGCVSQEFIEKYTHFAYDKNLDLIFPILEYVSYVEDGKNFDKDPDRTSSYATAVVSAIIALMYSAGIIDDKSTKTEIISFFKKITNGQKDNFKFINPITT